ncbi:uncharacterized protein LOC143288757 [Babylonia areolata]|uniref:uncharacterized protein LOC143288757 n=1 Tax=Babylonia areolata TaxID=304850 RepID=UPI003FD21F44
MMADDNSFQFDLSTHSFSFGGTCSNCTGKDKEIECLRRDQAIKEANFKTLKQKIIATDQLLRQFRAKTVDILFCCAKQEKEIEEWVRKYEKSQREVTVLENQLRKTLEDMEPVKRAKGGLEKRLEELEKDKEKLHGQLNQAEFLNNQYEMRVASLESAKNVKDEASTESKKKHSAMESKVKQQTKKINKLQTENKALKIDATKHSRKEKRLQTRLKRTENKLLKHLEILVQNGLMTKKAKAKVMATASRLDRNEDSDLGSASDDEQSLSGFETEEDDEEKDLNEVSDQTETCKSVADHATHSATSSTRLLKTHTAQTPSLVKSPSSRLKKAAHDGRQEGGRKNSQHASELLDELMDWTHPVLSPLPPSPLSAERDSRTPPPEPRAAECPASPMEDSDDDFIDVADEGGTRPMMDNSGPTPEHERSGLPVSRREKSDEVPSPVVRSVSTDKQGSHAGRTDSVFHSTDTSGKPQSRVVSLSVNARQQSVGEGGAGGEAGLSSPSNSLLHKNDRAKSSDTVVQPSHSLEKSAPSSPHRSVSLPCEVSSPNKHRSIVSAAGDAFVLPAPKLPAVMRLQSANEGVSPCDETGDHSVKSGFSKSGDVSNHRTESGMGDASNIDSGIAFQLKSTSSTHGESKSEPGTSEFFRTEAVSAGGHPRTVTPGRPDRHESGAGSVGKAPEQQILASGSSDHIPTTPSADQILGVAQMGRCQRGSNLKPAEGERSADTVQDRGLKHKDGGRRETPPQPGPRRMVTRRMSRLESTDSEQDLSQSPKKRLSTPLHSATALPGSSVWKKGEEDVVGFGEEWAVDQAASAIDRMLDDFLYSSSDLKSPEPPPGGKRCSTSSEKENKPSVRTSSQKENEPSMKKSPPARSMVAASANRLNSPLTPIEQSSAQQAGEGWRTRSPVKLHAMSPATTAPSPSSLAFGQHNSYSMGWGKLREDLDMSSDESESDDDDDDEKETTEREVVEAPGEKLHRQTGTSQDSEGLQGKRHQAESCASSVSKVITTSQPDPLRVIHDHGTLSKPPSDAPAPPHCLPSDPQGSRPPERTIAFADVSERLSSPSSESGSDTSDLSFSDSSLPPHTSSSGQGRRRQGQIQNRGQRSERRKASIKRREQLDVLQWKTKESVSSAGEYQVAEGKDRQTVRSARQVVPSPLLSSGPPHPHSVDVDSSTQSLPGNPPVNKKTIPAKEDSDPSQGGGQGLENTSQMSSKGQQAKKVHTRRRRVKTAAVIESDSSDSDGSGSTTVMPPKAGGGDCPERSSVHGNPATVTVLGVRKENSTCETITSASKTMVSIDTHTPPSSHVDAALVKCSPGQASQLQSGYNVAASPTVQATHTEVSSKQALEEKCSSTTQPPGVSAPGCRLPSGSDGCSWDADFIPVGMCHTYLSHDHKYAAKPSSPAVENCHAAHRTAHTTVDHSREFYATRFVYAGQLVASEGIVQQCPNSGNERVPDTQSQPESSVSFLGQDSCGNSETVIKQSGVVPDVLGDAEGSGAAVNTDRSAQNWDGTEQPSSAPSHTPHCDAHSQDGDLAGTRYSDILQDQGHPQPDGSCLRPCAALSLSDIEADCDRKQASVHPGVIRPEAIALKSPVSELGP